MSLYGQSWLRAEQQRSDAMKRERDKIIDEALTMNTNNKHILALRKELEFYKASTKRWEKMADESDQDIDDILKAANVETIPEVLEILKNRA